MRFDGKFGFFGGNVEDDETIESTLQRELREVCHKYCSVLQCVAACCSVLQRVAACCSVLKRVAVCCSTRLIQAFTNSNTCLWNEWAHKSLRTVSLKWVSPRVNVSGNLDEEEPLNGSGIPGNEWVLESLRCISLNWDIYPLIEWALTWIRVNTTILAMSRERSAWMHCMYPLNERAP